MKIHPALFKSGIYIIVSPNRVYVGQSKNLRKRAYEHSRLLRNGTHSNKHLQSAYNKYDGDMFWVGVEYTEDLSALTALETYWIDKFNSYYNGYNQTIAADSTGTPRSDEVKKILSEITTERWKDPKFREQCFLGRQRHLSDPEVRKRMSEATKDYCRNNPDVVARHSELMKIKFSTDERKDSFIRRMKTWRASVPKDELSRIAVERMSKRTETDWEIVRLKSNITLCSNPANGVEFREMPTRVGNLFTYAVARWTNSDGRNVVKMFSVSKYGLFPAYAMAVKTRQEANITIVDECNKRLKELAVNK